MESRLQERLRVSRTNFESLSNKKKENFNIRSKEKAQITRCLKFKRLNYFSPAICIDTPTHTRTGTRVGTGLEEEPECGGLKYLGKEIRLDPAVIGSHGRF